MRTPVPRQLLTACQCGRLRQCGPNDGTVTLMTVTLATVMTVALMTVTLMTVTLS